MCNRCYGGVLAVLSLLSALPAFADPDPKPPSGEAKALPRVVYLQETIDWKIPRKVEAQSPKAFTQALLLRQFFRQSLLIAARDELGLTTRDAALGDTMPADEDGGPLLMGAKYEKSPGVYIQRLGDKTSHVSDYKFDGDYLNSAASAEEMSCQWCVEVLKKLGFSGEPNKRNSDAKVPEQVEPLLAQMTFTSQFQAIRLLHEAIRRDGESDELLGALVRGYANLGWLTEHHWLAGPDVFKARAILYAQRMVARGDHPAWANWHRAYALAAIGLHAKALADLKSGDGFLGNEDSDENSKASLENKRPTWADLIEAHCLFKLDDLKPDKTDQSYRQLVELLRLISMELSNGKQNRIYHVQATMAAVQAMPECYRAIDSLCSRSGVGLGHSTTLVGLQTIGQKLYSRLAAISDLPAEVQAMAAKRAVTGGGLGRLFGMDTSSAKEFVVRGQLIEALMGLPDTDEEDSSDAPAASEQELPKTDSTREVDRGEPSWATLGYLIRETSFVQVWRRARFERFDLGASTDDFLEIAAPLIEHHPCRVFIEVHTSNLSKERQALSRLHELPVGNLDLTAWRVLRPFKMKSRQDVCRIADLLLDNCDAVSRDLSIIMPWIIKNESKKKYARDLHKVSPFCPYARGYLIQFDWETVNASADQWMKDARGHNAYVLGCLGSKYMNLKQYDDADRCYKGAIEVSPDMDLYRALAANYWYRGQTDKWLETLEEFLEQPSYGLEHSQIRIRIAQYYCALDDWEKALAYAEKAAQSYSNTSLRIAGECHERLANWAEAERYFQANARRYRMCSLRWYYFCRRTGHGNLEGAKKLAQAYANEAVKFNKTRRFNKIGIYYLLGNEHKKALDSFKKYFDENWVSYEGLHAALLADELGDIAERDRLLKEIDRRAKWLKGQKRYYDPEVCDLVKLIADDLTRGGKADFDSADYDKIVKNANEQPRMNCHYFLAKYLELRGKEDRSVHYWKLCLASHCMRGWNRTLAGKELINRGYKADCYKKPGEEKKELEPNEAKVESGKNETGSREQKHKQNGS